MSISDEIDDATIAIDEVTIVEIKATIWSRKCFRFFRFSANATEHNIVYIQAKETISRKKIDDLMKKARRNQRPQVPIQRLRYPTPRRELKIITTCKGLFIGRISRFWLSRSNTVLRLECLIYIRNKPIKKKENEQIKSPKRYTNYAPISKP